MNSRFRQYFPQLRRFLLAMFAAVPWWGSLSAATEDPLVNLTKTRLTSLLSEGSSIRRNAEATSALPPLVVPIKTRVVTGDGSQATNYSLMVGTNQYVAPPIFGGGGGSAGFHW